MDPKSQSASDGVEPAAKDLKREVREEMEEPNQSTVAQKMSRKRRLSDEEEEEVMEADMLSENEEEEGHKEMQRQSSDDATIIGQNEQEFGRNVAENNEMEEYDEMEKYDEMEEEEVIEEEEEIEVEVEEEEEEEEEDEEEEYEYEDDDDPSAGADEFDIYINNYKNIKAQIDVIKENEGMTETLAEQYTQLEEVIKTMSDLKMIHDQKAEDVRKLGRRVKILEMVIKKVTGKTY